MTAADQHFVPGLWALLTSLARHCPRRSVCVLDCGICDDSLRRLRWSFPNVEFCPLAEAEGLPFPSVGSMATYARLQLGRVFSRQNKLLYLDADVILLGDLRELDEIALDSNEVLAACVEPYTPTFGSHNGVLDYSELGFESSTPYFNAGVLLIDVPRWNDARIEARSLEYLRNPERRITLFDQEALNVTLARRWKKLEPEWNVSRFWMCADRRSARPGILSNARLVHFLSSDKPWIAPEKIAPWMLSIYREYSRDEALGR